MNTTNTFSKDNVAATIMLTALFTLIAAATLTSTSADAKEVSVKSTPHIETIVVTATRLK
jgi:outer membrane cobalamin receptor